MTGHPRAGGRSLGDTRQDIGWFTRILVSELWGVDFLSARLIRESYEIFDQLASTMPLEAPPRQTLFAGFPT